MVFQKWAHEIICPNQRFFSFPVRGQIIHYVVQDRCTLIGSLYLFFQLLKGRIADHVFHPASLLFRRFLIDASSYKLFRKELVSLIDFFSNFLACLGQMQKIIAVYC